MDIQQAADLTMVLDQGMQLGPVRKKKQGGRCGDQEACDRVQRLGEFGGLRVVDCAVVLVCVHIESRRLGPEWVLCDLGCKPFSPIGFCVFCFFSCGV